MSKRHGGKMPLRVMRGVKGDESASRPQVASVTPEPRPTAHFEEILNVRVNSLLYDQVKAMVEAGATINDPEAPVSIGAFMREALVAYQAEPFPLTERPAPGRKVATSFRVHEDTKAFYHGLPDRRRTATLECILRTYLKRRLG
jgi:hypothetical protein